MNAAIVRSFAQAKNRSSEPLERSYMFLQTLLMLRITALGIAFFAMSIVACAQEAVPVSTNIAINDPIRVELEEKVAALEKANKVLENRILVLEKSNKELAEDSGRLRQTISISRTAGRRFSNNMARRVFWNVSRHIAGMAGTSIPYVGAGVSVAMTSLDVQQGCESLKELNAMNREMSLDTEDESKVCGLQVPTKEEVIAQVLSNWRSVYASTAAWTNQYEVRLPSVPWEVSPTKLFELAKVVLQ